jgi:hypothetical protein
VGGARLPLFITFTITSKVAVYAPAEWADTITLYHVSYLLKLCTLWLEHTEQYWSRPADSTPCRLCSLLLTLMSALKWHFFLAVGKYQLTSFRNGCPVVFALYFFLLHRFIDMERCRLIRARIFKLLRNPTIDSKEPIPPGCVAWRAGIDNPIPTGFL